MKTRIIFVLLLSTVIVSTGFTFASEPANVKRGSSQIELNLLEGIEIKNEDVQVGSAYYLGEMKSYKAVLPLMKLLHEGSTESIRISAAAALIKIGESRGVFAVKQNGKFDDSEKVRRMCRVFYGDFLRTHKD